MKTAIDQADEETLRRMSDLELVRWAKLHGEALSEIRDHLAKRFPNDTRPSNAFRPRWSGLGWEWWDARKLD
jgi:hypothetical protein